MDYGFLNKYDYRLSLMRENIELVIYSILSFFVPFILSHPQILVGSVVNAALFMAALNTRKYKLIPVIMLPSLAVLSKGMIFGTLTPMLLYAIPFIWLGNALLVVSTKYFTIGKKRNKILSFSIAIALKVAVIFGAVFAMYSLGILPKVMLVAMGPMQLLTAVIGASIALGVHKIKKVLA